MITETENLEEMIKQADGVIFPAEDDQQAGEKTPAKKAEVLTFDTKTMEQVTQTDEVKKKDDLVPTPNYPEVVKLDYEPQTEEELIEHTRLLNTRLNYWQIGTYWLIGYKIKSFYERKGSYGTGKLTKIAKEVGLGEDTLRKCYRFAEKYTEQQLQTLLSGPFMLTWSHIAQNLTVEPEKLIEVHQECRSSKEFNNEIINFKDHDERRGKSRKVNDEPVEDVSGPFQDPVEPEIIDNVKMEENQVKETTGEPESIKALKDEISHLRDEMTSKDRRIKELERLIDEMTRDLEEKETLISSIKHGLDGITDMGDDGADRWGILEAVEELTSNI